MPRALLYHDVVQDDFDESGFRGGGAAQYKLRADEFQEHLNALADKRVRSSVLSHLHDGRMQNDRDSFLLTFDDGGVSAISIAESLERLGWRGHFLVTVDYIGTSGFLTGAQIRELDRRGHVIGSHSCSHPTRMSACTRPQLYTEWSRSREVLSDILGKPVVAASIPGGYYSRAVADAASEAGLEHLFTSEPTPRTWKVGRCYVYGRYTVYRGMPPSAAAALASGSPLPMLQQAATWKLKKVLKTLGGKAYLELREFLLNRKLQR